MSRCERAGVLLARSDQECPEWEAVFDPFINRELQVRLCHHQPGATILCLDCVFQLNYVAASAS